MTNKKIKQKREYTKDDGTTVPVPQPKSIIEAKKQISKFNKYTEQFY